MTLEPCLCGDPGCARCGCPLDPRFYLDAAACDCEPEPPEDADAWHDWDEVHPYSRTDGVGRVCLLTPVGGSDS